MKKDKLWNELQEGYRELFNSYPYEIMMTVHFGKISLRNENANKRLKQLMTKIAKISKSQIACFGIYNTLKSPHAHLLLFGKTKSLKDLSKGEIEKIWRYGSVLIDNSPDKGAAFYTALNVTPHVQDRYEPFFYNFRLLKKYRSVIPRVELNKPINPEVSKD